MSSQRLQGDPPDALIRRDSVYKSWGWRRRPGHGGRGDPCGASGAAEPILDDGAHAMIGRPRERAASGPLGTIERIGTNVLSAVMCSHDRAAPRSPDRVAELSLRRDLADAAIVVL